jgi:hypothetical protein
MRHYTTCLPRNIGSKLINFIETALTASPVVRFLHYNYTE